MIILHILLTLLILYLFAYAAFTVNYLGFRTVVGSNMADRLFPWAASLYPMDHGTYWPTSKKEDTSGSFGMSPMGGMR